MQGFGVGAKNCRMFCSNTHFNHSQIHLPLRNMILFNKISLFGLGVMRQKKTKSTVSIEFNLWSVQQVLKLFQQRNPQKYFVGWLDTTDRASFTIALNLRPIIARITPLDWTIQKTPFRKYFSNVFRTVEEESCNPKWPKHIESGTFDVIDNWSGWDWSFLLAWW